MAAGKVVGTWGGGMACIAADGLVRTAREGHIMLLLFVIHTLLLNFLFSGWLFSKYVECIENVYCSPRTAPRLLDVLLVRDRAGDCHID